jgi:hypothetical protein
MNHIPMCLLPTMRQFLDDLPVDRGLRVNKAPEVERIAHVATPSTVITQSSEQACRPYRTHGNQMRTLPPMTMDSECPAERSNCQNPVLPSKSTDD